MHGISETDYPAGLLLGKKIEAADFVACVSYYGRAQAMRTVPPEHWSKLHVVRCGLSLAHLPAHTGSGNRRRIISVGRLSPEKGQAGLLEAFASILTHSPDVDLVLVGDGPQAGALQARAEALGISNNVTFLGRLGERATLDQIAASDILVLSSFMEGLPVVLMEAMAVGTAVISSRVAGIPELVDEGTSGLLFTPSKWDELAASIHRLLADQKLRTTLSEKGKVTVRDGFDIRTSASQLLRLFSGVAS